MEDPADHLRLVAKITRRYTVAKPLQDTEEYADGLLGCWLACLSHEPERGAFSTHAWNCIRREIIKGRQGRNLSGYKHAATRRRRGNPPTLLAFYQVFRAPGYSSEESPESFIPDRRTADGPVQSLDAAEQLAPLLTLLTDRERFVLCEWYGKERRLEDIGRDLGLTKQRVAQIVKIALAKCRGEPVPSKAKKVKCA